MKVMKYITLALLLSLSVFTDMQAKRVKMPQVYMFGFSASFNDSIVFFTEIQEVRDAWIDTKTKFLLGRDNYSYQLKDYFNNQMQMPDRICITIFALDKSKVEKKYQKLKKKYLANPNKKKKSKKREVLYDVRYLTLSDFKFETVDVEN